MRVGARIVGACAAGAVLLAIAAYQMETGSPANMVAGSPAVARGAARVAVPAPPWQADPPGPALLAPGSDPSVLPGDLLIADKRNNRLIVIDPQGRLRWEFPRPGDLAPGQTFVIPDDAFFSADGREIVATQEDDFVISIIDVASHRIVYRYGTAGHPGSGPNQLDNPDDAMLLPDGYLVSADIKNCRILLIAPGGHTPSTVYGSGRPCQHQPPQRFGSPNGAFLMRDGNLLVTEINGDYVDEMRPDGSIVWTTHPPGVAYPSDANQIGPDQYLVVDYSSPGQAVIFNRAGQVLWRYRPTGAAALNHPSLAIGLPGGDVLVTDDLNHRVIVVDPRTNAVVWQYGHTGVASAAPGYLDNPDGLDLVPPLSFIDTHSAAQRMPGHQPVDG